ncbi:caspase recruitment domain-containing protein 6 [Artibeus jamaicensis]|uniref:caspase recruitment domain-containing protein 6 n=1 Tax=Artibeus jamaicensis TaxID=9417 RepID=UPI00235AF17B|nr:caspase recruitment domain-containing protein 6 [Artibeus jamaicensis]
MAAGSASSEMIERERKKLLEILQRDLDSVLDSLSSRRLISEDEYEALEDMTDPLKKSRKLLILVQKKGEVSCQHFLKCLFSTFPESATTWGLRHEFSQHENTEPLESMGMSKSSEEPLSRGEKQPENSEPTVPCTDKEHLDLETSETFLDKKTSYGGTAWPWRAGDKDGHIPAVPLPRSGEEVHYEVSEAVYHLQDGQRYDEIDDSLYLGEEDYLESVMCSEDADSAVEKEDPSDPEHLVYAGEQEPVYLETTEFSLEEQSGGGSEMGLSLEEEKEERMEERRRVFKDVLSCLNLDRSRKLWPDVVRQFSLDRGCKWTPETPGDLAWNFLMKVQALDVTARDSVLRQDALHAESGGEWPAGVEKAAIRDVRAVHPLDVLCASVLCSDSALQRQVLASMYRCRFALPLLLPDAENNRSILMLGAMRDVVKEQPARALGGPAGETEKFLMRMKMPVISFVRLGDCSISKSRILNALLRPDPQKSRKIFLHRDGALPGSPRQISEGLVEIAWCFPDGDSLMENAHLFQEPVAVTNLRGDIERFWLQFGFLMEVSSAVFFFTDCLGEKEWDLLMFLGEAAIERCYFVLSSQARESEEAQMFQTILNLRPSQLLFWEEEEAGETEGNMESLQAALREVTSSSLRRLSVEDMGPLARELGIQVDQDLENVEGTRVPPSEDRAGTVEDEGPQRHRQPESSSKSTAELPVKEPGAGGEVSPAPQGGHLSPGVRPHPQNSCFFPIMIGGHFNHVPLRAPWVMGSRFGSRQKSRWFYPSTFQNSWVHSQGRSFGVQHFQPLRFCSGGRLIKFSRPPRGHPMRGLFGRPLRPGSQCVQARPRRPQATGACERPAIIMASQIRPPHPLGSRPEGPLGKLQPKQAHLRAAQPAEATGKLMRTPFHTVDPHSQVCQPAGVMQRPVRPTFQQGFKPKTQGGPLNPAVQMGSHPTSSNKFLPGSPFSQPKPSQYKHPQPKPSQPTSSQPKPTQTKPPQPQPSQAKSSPSRPAQSQPRQPQPSQAKSSPSRPTQSQPRQPQSSQPRPQPRPTQPRSSQASHSQAKTSYARAGPRRGGKH